MLLTEDGQKVSAGRCDEPLSVNADAIGFYRTRYDAATFGTNSKNFGGLPDGDRIALLDDQWALVESGKETLATYLTLASAMGSSLDTRAWEQIVDALKAKGKPVEYMLFLDEGHGFAKPANRLKFYAAAEAFLARHLAA